MVPVILMSSGSSIGIISLLYSTIAAMQTKYLNGHIDKTTTLGLFQNQCDTAVSVTGYHKIIGCHWESCGYKQIIYP